MQAIFSILLKKLQHFCAYQDRCRFEVEKKLNDLEADEETKKEVLYQLELEDYLNEERFARSIARGKFRIHHWGKNKIIPYLKARNVEDAIISSALNEIDEQEYHQQLKLILDKAFSEKKDLNKSIQATIAKGFETELVYELAAGLK